MIGLWSDWRLKKGGWRPAVVVDPVAIGNVPDRVHQVFEVFNHTSTTIGRIRKQGLVLLLEPFIVRGTWMFETCCREAILWWSSRNPSSTLRGTFGSTDYYGAAFDHFGHCVHCWVMTMKGAWLGVVQKRLRGMWDTSPGMCKAVHYFRPNNPFLMIGHWLWKTFKPYNAN